jgi:hypothetical protein
VSAYPQENRYGYFVSTANAVGKKWAWMEINVKFITTIDVRLHGGDYEECRLLGRGAVWIYYKPTFRRNVSPPSSG